MKLPCFAGVAAKSEASMFRGACRGERDSLLGGSSPYVALDPFFYPIRNLAAAFLCIEHVIRQTQAPGDVAPRGVGLQSRQIVGVTFEIGDVAAEAFRDKSWPVPEDSRSDIVEIIFRMVLDAPKDAMAEADLCCLYFAHIVGGGDDRVLGQFRQLIAMNRRRVENDGAARMHRMVAPGGGERDLSGKSDFPAARIGPDLAARGHGRDLQAPA